MPQTNHHTTANEASRVNGQAVPPPISPGMHSEEVQDIMSRMPHWIVRWGTTLLFGLLLLLLAGAWVLRYPDVLVTGISITSASPPLKVVAPAGGRIRQLFVRNNQQVREEQPLC